MTTQGIPSHPVIPAKAGIQSPVQVGGVSEEPDSRLRGNDLGRREIFLLAGEASGDVRGAELIRALRARDPALRFSGMGGPRMREAGMEVLVDLTDLAVVGIVEVLRHYGTFKRAMAQLLDEIRRCRPVAVIGVDYPGFNLRLLRKVHAFDPGRTPPRTGSAPAHPQAIRLAQYVSPQLWAWDERRKWRMARFLDQVLCLFPFEPAIYAPTGLKAVFVGHPLGRRPFLGEAGRRRDLLAFFPGSREKEIRAHMPVLAGVADRLRTTRPALRVAYGCASPANAATIRSFCPAAEIMEPVELQDSATAGIVCSGTATLEAAMAGLPICVIYRVAWPTYWMGRALIKVPHLAMPNLLAERLLVKEFIQADCTVERLLPEAERLLDNADARATIRTGYEQIRTRLGNGNAADQAAAEILKLTGG